MKIDVVVPAYNAEGFIEACLDGLFAAGFPANAITVVDDGSTDRTAAMSTAKGVAPLPMGRNSSASVARNAGAAQGRAEVLFFVDADVVVAGDSKERVAAFFAEHPDHHAVFGSYDAHPTAAGRVSRFRNLLHRHVHCSGAGEAVTFWTGIGAVRRSAFEAVGGFDPQIEMMEDIELGLRLKDHGFRIMLDPDIQGTHLKAWSLASMIHTDLFHRAIPWTRLLRRPAARGAPKTLNINATGRISVICVAASLVAPLLLPWAPWAGLGGLAAALSLLAWTNRRFLQMLWREHSATDALTAVPLLWVHYLTAGLGYIVGRLRG